MSNKVPPYTGQIIIERGFGTRQEAEDWMANEAATVSPYAHVEKRLWEPASPIGAKEVEGIAPFEKCSCLADAAPCERCPDRVR